MIIILNPSSTTQLPCLACTNGVAEQLVFDADLVSCVLRGAMYDSPDVGIEAMWCLYNICNGGSDTHVINLVHRGSVQAVRQLLLHWASSHTASGTELNNSLACLEILEIMMKVIDNV